MLSLTPRQSGSPPQSVCGAPCYFHQAASDSAFGAIFFEATLRSLFVTVAVGMRITLHPPRGSGLEGLPHPALALGSDGYATGRIGVTDTGRGEPPEEQSLHAFPRHIAGLAPATQHTMPVPSYLATKSLQCRDVARYTVVAVVATHDRSQPLPLVLERFMHAPPQFDVDRL